MSGDVRRGLARPVVNNGGLVLRQFFRYHGELREVRDSKRGRDRNV